jgi:hypothetical protein
LLLLPEAANGLRGKGKSVLSLNAHTVSADYNNLLGAKLPLSGVSFLPQDKTKALLHESSFD